MKILKIAKNFNKYNLSNFTPIKIGNVNVGWVNRKNMRLLEEFSDFFSIKKKTIIIKSKWDTAKKLNDIFGITIASLVQKKIIKKRNEFFPVFYYPALKIPEKINFKKPHFRIDRSAIRFFGFRSWGVHLNGFTNQDGKIKIWIAKRSKNKSSYPSKLDNLVGGGQPAGLSVKENLIKESSEEANIKKSLIRKAKSVGSISYKIETSEGLCLDTMFIYDLKLPETFRPKCNDKEIDKFFLMSENKVFKKINNNFDFKANSKLVVLDFLIRKGILFEKQERYINQFFSEINRRF